MPVMRRLMQAGANVWCVLMAAATVMAADGKVDLQLAPQYSFELPAASGGTAGVEGTDPARLDVVCFLGTECPLALLYGPRLQALAEKYADHNVHVIGVNSNRQDSMTELREYGKKLQLKFPLVKDYDQTIAARYKATRTPEVFVIRGGRTIVYQGRIDDQYQPGRARQEPSRKDLDWALHELVTGKPVRVATTPAVGCLISYGQVTKPTEVTYTKEVTRILEKRCVECHREGEIGPFALTEYEEVIGWGEMMLEVVGNGRMPPWHAADDVGYFANARLMPDSEKQTLTEWVRGGMPYGDAADLPEPVTYASGWHLETDPDQVVSMERPFRVPADGVIEYQYFVVDPGFTEDKWVRGTQVIPGSPEVVHHCIVFIRPPDGAKARGVGWLSAFVPGQRAGLFPEGTARKVPAGSKLVFQMHYTPNGSVREDVTKVGLWFADESRVTRETYTLMALNKEFEIPPRDGNFPVEGSLRRVPKNGMLLALAPHMHVRGKSFDVVARRNGEQVPLLSVPQYDFNWQHVYVLDKPLPLADIDAISFTARFDNSADNPVNPDPNQYVHWGDQTWEEMAIAFFEISEPRESASKEASGESALDVLQGRNRQNLSAEQRREAFVKRFFERFDADGDGFVLRDDVPLSVQRFGFDKYDTNGDGRLDRDEVAAAHERLR